MRMAWKKVGSTIDPIHSDRNTDWGSIGHLICNLAGHQRAFKMKPFLTNLALVNVVLYAVGRTLPFFGEFASTWSWSAIVAFYFLLTAGLVGWLNRASRRSPIRFVTAVNGSTAIKMLTSLAAVTTYLVVVGGEFRVQFALGLFTVFAFNTVLLVVEAQKISKNRPD